MQKQVKIIDKSERIFKFKKIGNKKDKRLTHEIIN